MANEQNLLRGNEKHEFTPEEHRRGAAASAEARRKKRDLRLALEMLLEREIKGGNGKDYRHRSNNGAIIQRSHDGKRPRFRGFAGYSRTETC